jgi:hypothetical protein
MNNILKLNGVEKAISVRKTSRIAPDEITDSDYMFPAFSNGEVLLNKKWHGSVHSHGMVETSAIDAGKVGNFYKINLA